ncbi:uncharacterized protein LOC126904963 [Daktulosphaira vitifoliae]|uniref:uncharacterized protein LOC126904963 n=1 Tax=Daktulosphaira vitifoliae TaxID=58002 RepID=UPI0021A98B47|nr:uncharacterized protein LOC126904963 [Daktulosphaira vitifoliae]
MAYDDKDITVIAQSEEKYISFSKTISDYFQLEFIDSYRFLQASLYQLTTTLTLPDFALSLNVFKSLELVTRKSVFPYEYVDSWEKLDENQLPTHENFYSSITKTTVFEEDYEHAKKMWQHFECKTIGDYSDKYLLVDVMVLADIFEKFRAESLKNYSLDPTHYYSCPALSFDAMLKYTDVNIELITDPDMLLMFELDIHGGLTQVNQRYARANHPGISDYNPNIPHKYLQYLDATNLYGTVINVKKQPGTFTDECKGMHMEEIVALLPKVYAYLIAYKNYKNFLRQEEVKRLKGINMGVVKHEINMVDYLNCLRNKLKQIHKKISIICSKHHNVLTVETRKLALSNNYDKRAIVGDEFGYKNVYTKA